MIKAVVVMIFCVIFGILGVYLESFAVFIISSLVFLIFECIAVVAYEGLKDRLSKVEAELKAISTGRLYKKPDFTNHDGSHDYD